MAVSTVVQGLAKTLSKGLNPFLDSLILLFLRYAPASLKDPLLGIFAPFSTEKNIRRLSTILLVNVALRLLKRLSDALTLRKENNWVKDDYNFSKESVLITGGSSGIGERVVQLLAQKYIKVIVLDIQPLKPETAKYKTVHFYSCDITKPEEVATIATQVRNDHGDPSVLINNAGIGTYEPILEKPLAKIQKLFDVNLLSHFTLLKEFLPSMVKNNHGHIVTIASMASFMSVGGLADYATSKAALVALHETLRQELRFIYKADRVRTSIIHPSWVQTPIIGPWEGDLKKSKKHKIMSVDDVAVPIFDLIMEGKSRQILLPKVPMIWVVASMRGGPLWFQESLRDLSRLLP